MFTHVIKFEGKRAPIVQILIRPPISDSTTVILCSIAELYGELGTEQWKSNHSSAFVYIL